MTIRFIVLDIKKYEIILKIPLGYHFAFAIIYYIRHAKTIHKIFINSNQYMGQKIKQSSITILFLGIVFFTFSCSKDDLDVQPTQLRVNKQELPDIKIYAGKELPDQIVQRLEKSMKSLSKSQPSQESYTTSFGEILFNKILHVTSTSGIENYTFKVVVEDNDPKTFYNLILRKNPDGFFEEPYLKKYEMNDDFFYQYNLGLVSFDAFEGVFYNYAINEVLDIDVLLSGKNRNSSCPVAIGNDPDDEETGEQGDVIGGGDINTNGGGGGGNTGDNSSGPSGNSGTNGGGGSVSCSSSIIQVVCNGGGGHLGDAHCTGSFKGASFLRISCSDGTVIDIKSAGNRSNCIVDQGDIGTLDDVIPPCKKFRELAEDDGFKQKMRELKQKAMTDNKETGHKLTKGPDGNMQFDEAIEGEEGKLGLPPVNLEQGEKLDGFVHNHYDQDKSLSVFSPEDLWSLYIMLKNNHIKKTSTFIFVVTTSDGTNYALSIKSSSKFIAFGDVNLQGLDIEDNNALPALYAGEQKIDFPNGIKDSNGNGLNERHFAKLLKSANTGIELYRSTDDFESWEKVEIDENNNITYDDCN